MAAYTAPLAGLDSAHKMLLLAGAEPNLLASRLTGPQLSALDADATAAGKSRARFVSTLIKL